MSNKNREFFCKAGKISVEFSMQNGKWLNQMMSEAATGSQLPPPIFYAPPDAMGPGGQKSMTADMGMEATVWASSRSRLLPCRQLTDAGGGSSEPPGAGGSTEVTRNVTRSEVGPCHVPSVGGWARGDTLCRGGGGNPPGGPGLQVISTSCERPWVPIPW